MHFKFSKTRVWSARTPVSASLGSRHTEDVQARAIGVCLQIYCWFMSCLGINTASDTIPVSAILWWCNHPKRTSEVGNLLLEEFATTNCNPSVAEGDLLGMAAAPDVVSAGRRSCRTCWPSTSPTVSVNSHKVKQMPALTPVESLKGEEDLVGTLSL